MFSSDTQYTPHCPHNNPISIQHLHCLFPKRDNQRSVLDPLLVSSDRGPQLRPILFEQRQEQPYLICSSGITKLHTNTLNNFNCKSIARPSAYSSYAVWPLLLNKPNYADICTNTPLTYTNYPTLPRRLSVSLPGDVILLPNPVRHSPTTSCTRIRNGGFCSEKKLSATFSYQSSKQVRCAPQLVRGYVYCRGHATRLRGATGSTPRSTVPL
jgi:hypothetical protein